MGACANKEEVSTCAIVNNWKELWEKKKKWWSRGASQIRFRARLDNKSGNLVLKKVKCQPRDVKSGFERPWHTLIDGWPRQRLQNSIRTVSFIGDQAIILLLGIAIGRATEISTPSCKWCSWKWTLTKLTGIGVKQETVLRLSYKEQS